MVKNPWTHLRWKGRYSENDLTNWTQDLQRRLDYDPKKAKERDDGEDFPLLSNKYKGKVL